MPNMKRRKIIILNNAHFCMFTTQEYCEEVSVAIKIPCNVKNKIKTAQYFDCVVDVSWIHLLIQ